MSAVDPETEAAVHDALCELMKDRTTFIIAHHSTAFIERIDRAYTPEAGHLMRAPVVSPAPARGRGLEVLNT